MFVFFNPNPGAKRVGDCAVRAIAKAMGTDWEKTYLALCVEGLGAPGMPSGNRDGGGCLKAKGWGRRRLPRRPRSPSLEDSGP